MSLLPTTNEWADHQEAIAVKEQLKRVTKQLDELLEAIDSIVDFGTTVAGSSSYREDTWTEFEAMVDRAKEKNDAP